MCASERSRSIAELAARLASTESLAFLSGADRAKIAEQVRQLFPAASPRDVWVGMPQVARGRLAWLPGTARDEVSHEGIGAVTHLARTTIQRLLDGQVITAPVEELGTAQWSLRDGETWRPEPARSLQWWAQFRREFLALVRDAMTARSHFPFGACRLCGAVFARHTLGRPQIYCSERCRMRGVPFSGKRVERARQRRHARREQEIEKVRRIIRANPGAGEDDLIDKLREPFWGKSRQQRLYLVRAARRSSRGKKMKVTSGSARIA